MTDNEFWEFINSVNSQKILLAGISYHDVNEGVDKTLYISNKRFVTSPTDSLANVAFDPVLNMTTHVLQNSLSIPNPTSNQLSISVDAIIDELEIINKDGIYDYLLQHIFDDHPINIYLGDLSFPFSEFRVIKKLIGSNLTCKGEYTLSLQFSSLDGVFNRDVQRNFITCGPSKGTPIPLAYGFVRRVVPVFLGINPKTGFGRYKVNEYSIHSITSVQDNGADILSQVVQYLNVGEFELKTTPVGTVTVNLWGTTDSSGNCITKAGNIIQHIITNKTDSGILIDSASLAAFNSSVYEDMGYFINQRMNINEVFDAILSACLGFRYFTSSDKMFLGHFKLVKETTPVEIDNLHILSEGGGVVMDSAFIMPIASIRVLYNRNYYPTDNLVAGLTEDMIELKRTPFRVYNSGTIFDDNIEALSLTNVTPTTALLNLKTTSMSDAGVTDLKTSVKVGDYVSISMAFNTENIGSFKIIGVDTSSVTISIVGGVQELAGSSSILTLFLKKSDVLSKFKNPIFATDRETMFRERAGAENQANNLLSIYDRIRRIYTITMSNQNISFKMLQHLKIFSNRYGMSSGVDAWVISCPDTTFSLGSMEIKVIV